LNAEHEVVWESELLNPENELGEYPLGPPSLTVDLVAEEGEGIAGDFVRVEREPDPDLSGSGGLGDATEMDVLSLAEVVVYPPGGVTDTQRFVRGDANSDSKIDLTDGIVILNFLFLGGEAPACMDAADVDDSGGDKLVLTDAVRLFNWLYLGGDVPPPPSPSTAGYLREECGPDPTDDDMGCLTLSETCE
jgi:hypothetical protein